MKLAYEAVDAKGKKVHSTLQAATVKAGVEELRRQGLFVTTINAQREEGSARAGGAAERSGADGAAADRAVEKNRTGPADLARLRLPLGAKILFTRQVSMLLTSGSALAPALQAVAQQMPNPAHRQLVEALTRDLEQGLPLAESMRKYPKCFDSAYCAVVAAGESSASLPKMFSRLAAILGKRRATRNRVIGALIYPSMLIVLSVGILAVMLFFVVPRFAGMFGSIGVPLPVSTKVLLALAELIRSIWPALLGLGLAGLGGLYFLIRTDAGRQVAANLQVRIPLIGRVASRLIQAQAFRILGMLVEARVGLLDALDLARGVTRNDLFQKMFTDLVDAVTRGDSLSGALEHHKLLSAPVVQALRTGEQSGRLGEAVSYIADVLDEENGELLNTLVRLIEPAILIGMGLVVGTVAISLFMPLFDMTSAV